MPSFVGNMLISKTHHLVKEEVNCNNMKIVISILFLIQIFSSLSQINIGLESNNKGLINWKVENKKNSFIKVNSKDASISIEGKKTCLIHKKKVELNKNIYTFNLSIYIPESPKKIKLGEFSFYYTYKDKVYGRQKEIFMTIDSLCKDSLEYNNWYTFSKSIYLKNQDEIQLGFSYNADSFSSIILKQFNLEESRIDDFFKNGNLVLNGGFEVNNKIPTELYSGFSSVPFWQENIDFGCVQTRIKNPIEYEIDKASYYNGFTLGSPDLISNETFSLSDTGIVYKGNYCTRFHCSTFRTKKTNYLNGEYLQTRLRNKLIKNEVYTLYLAIKLSSKSTHTINNFGVILSECALDVYDDLMFQKKNHLSNEILHSNYLNVTDGWVKVSLTYVAKGGEEYLTFGCFDSKFSSYYPKINNSKKGIMIDGSIVFVDDIVLSKISNDKAFDRK
jgi:hypothetical protein